MEKAFSDNFKSIVPNEMLLFNNERNGYIR